MRKSLLFLSVLMCFSVLTGCGASEAEQAAMDKMSADYSDTFSYEKREGDGFLVKSDALDADVYVEKADDGEYHDNYLAVKDDVFDTLSVDEIQERIESGDVVAHADLIKQGDSVQINWLSE